MSNFFIGVGGYLFDALKLIIAISAGVFIGTRLRIRKNRWSTK